MNRFLALLLVCTYGCKAAPDFTAVPCQDTSTIISPGGAETVKSVECHPQASIDTTPVGSAVVVTCRCNTLPNPPCGCDWHPIDDGGTEE